MSNRVIKFFRKQEREKEREKQIVPPPCDRKEREEYFHDSVFQALAFLRSKLRSEDSAEGMEAATAILNLEATRMRHGQRVAGTGNGVMSKEEYEAEMDRTVHGTRPAKPATVAQPVPEPAPAAVPTKQPVDPEEEKERKTFEDLVKFAYDYAPVAAKEVGITGWSMSLGEALRMIEDMLNEREKRATEMTRLEVAEEIFAICFYIKKQREKQASAVPA